MCRCCHSMDVRVPGMPQVLGITRLRRTRSTFSEATSRITIMNQNDLSIS